MSYIKKLIIAEKPSVAKEFAKVLKETAKSFDGYLESENYIITWCVGHLVTMSYPEKYNEKLKYWNLYSLPFIPKDFKYEVIEDVKKQFNTVERLLNREDVETIYVSTDSGREGEYIYRLVDEMAKVKCQDKRRIWIDSQTEEAILNGIKDAKPLSCYDALASSAYLRAKEDYLIGINFSRLLSVVYGKSLAQKLGEERAVISIGRVMTCVLGMIVNREREIRNFKKVNYYKLQGDFGGILADYKILEGSKYFESPKLYNETGFKKEEFAKEAREYILANKDKAVIDEVTKKNTKENAPLLFNLAELQNECTKRYKISPDQTLQIAQSLYEKKLTTYPRTDARVLSTAAAKEISKNLNGMAKWGKDEIVKFGIDTMIKEKYKTDILKSKYVNDTKITDHYAIIPTGQGYENFEKLTELEKKVYVMICIRFLSIFYPPAEYSRLSVKIKVENETFVTSGRVCLKEGYLTLLNKEKERNQSEKKTDIKNEVVDEVEQANIKKEEEKEIENNLDALKNLKKGMPISLDDIKIKTSETSPPTRYNSGLMILAMENAGKLIEDERLREQIKSAGIGTSATRAEIIKKLERIGYICTNNKTQILTPTKKGEYIFDIVKSSMPDLLNPTLTASWEKGLTMVADEEISADEFMKKLSRYICDKVYKFRDMGY